MKIILKTSAQKTIQRISEYVEDLNTEGAGVIWAEKFILQISKYAQPIRYALCRHKFWANKNFHCIAVRNWVVIFKIENDTFIVFRIIHASTFK